jgi:hypothetical protein
MAHKWNKTKKKTVLRIRLGSDQGRSRCLVALSKRSCSREQDRETNGLIAALGTRSHSAAVQTIESAAESEIGPIEGQGPFQAAFTDEAPRADDVRDDVDCKGHGDSPFSPPLDCE